MSTFTLKSFDISSLPSLPLSDRIQLPSCAAVYFALSASGRVLYVGQSIDLRERLRRHHRVALLDALGNVRIAWLKESNSLALRRIETALIKHFNPPLNRIPSFLKEQDTEKLIECLTLNECAYKSNVIPINKLLTQSTQLLEETSRRTGMPVGDPQATSLRTLTSQSSQTESKLHSLLESRRVTPPEFKDVILEQAARIEHLEKEIADLRLMFQEQTQTCRQMAEALVEQAKVIKELGARDGKVP